MADEIEQPTTTPETGTEPGKQAGETKSAERTFTQAEVNQLIQDRLSRSEQSFLKKLGVTKIEEAQVATSKLKEIEDAQKTEAQKLQDKAAESERRAMQAEEKYRVSLIRSAVIEEAAKQGVAQDRYTAAYKLLDSSKLTINDNGEVVGIADAVKALLESSPFLKAEPLKQEEKGRGVVQPTNPANQTNVPDNLDWFKGANRIKKSPFGTGGVRPPAGEE